jgi:hypothetical protein
MEIISAATLFKDKKFYRMVESRGTELGRCIPRRPSKQVLRRSRDASRHGLSDRHSNYWVSNGQGGPSLDVGMMGELHELGLAIR